MTTPQRKPKPQALAVKLKSLRTAKGYTLDDLAKRTGSSKSYIWSLENDNPPRPSAAKMAVIAQALDVAVDYLIDEGRVMSLKNATDENFYRAYLACDKATKSKLRAILKILTA